MAPLGSQDIVYLPEQSVSLFDIYEIFETVLNSLATENFVRLPRL